MAISYLRLTDDFYWSSDPKLILAMIAEWHEIEAHKARIQAIAASGQDIPSARREVKQVKKKQPAIFY